MCTVTTGRARPFRRLRAAAGIAAARQREGDVPVIVLVAEENGEVRATVADAGNLRQLHAEFRGVPDEQAGAALSAAGLGRVDGGHAWLDAAALRAAGDGSAQWAARFDAMLGYAAGQGWASADGSAVRAHVVRS